MKYLKLFLRRRWVKLVTVLLLLAGQVVGTLLIPFLIAGIVDLGILKGDMNAVFRIGVQMLAVALLGATVSIFGSWVTGDIAALFGCDMRERLFRKTQELSVQQFESLGVSSLITRATSDIANLQQTMGLILQLAVPAPFIGVISILLTASVNLRMAFLQIFFSVILLCFGAYILKKSDALSHSIQVRLDRINKVVRESVTGVRVIRAFANEKYEEERAGKAFNDYAQNMITLNKLFAAVNPVVWLLMGLLMAAIVALGGALTLAENMAVGEITAVAEYAIITMAYLIMAAAALTGMPKARACLERLEEVLDTEPIVQDPVRPCTKMVPGAPAVEFEHVTFSYLGAEEPVIRDLSFTCRAGETTAVIGSTGSGKSTLADLLLRLHNVQAGTIRMFGVDIKNLSQNELRENIGCVPQKSFLFSGTIAGNLRMGKEDASDSDLWQALGIAQAKSFVESLPLQLKTPVAQGGTNFSGGQRQRLSIARALVKDACVFVFDDSFSALDVKTDSELRKALKCEVTEPAKLIIAQRVSTIIGADQILVLDEGQLAGAGRHEELLKTCAVYRAIAESQMNISEDTK